MNDADKKILDDGMEYLNRLLAEGKDAEAEAHLRNLFLIAKSMQARYEAEKAAEVTYG